MSSVTSMKVPPLNEPKKSETYELETLAAGHDMHRQISSDFQRYGLAVDSIERLVSYNCWKKYDDKKKEIQAREPKDPDFQLNETFLYHGTSSKNESTLYEDGFENDLKSDGSYGKGFYFSDTPKNFATSNVILVASVMLGESKEYEDGIKDLMLDREPTKDEPIKGWRFYDSVKGRPVNEKEYVVYRGESALTQFVVKFSKSNAPVPAPKPILRDMKPKLDVPHNITSMKMPTLKEPEDTQSKIFVLEPLTEDSDMYRQISSDFQEAGLAVESINSVRNHICWMKYNDKKKQIKARTPQDSAFQLNETYLYHGTTAKEKAILEEGFDVNLASEGHSCFGKGIYFSDTPRKCIKYAKENIILVTRVMLGEIKEYEDKAKDKTLLREPPKDEPFSGHKYYDSVKGRPRNFMEYVIYRNESALIEYIIKFSKSSSKESSKDKEFLSDTDTSTDSSDTDDDDFVDAVDHSSSSSEEEEEGEKNETESESGSETEAPKVLKAWGKDSVCPYFTLPEGELTLEQKKDEFKRVTLEENASEVDSMLNKTNEDLERAIYLFYAYKQVKDDEEKRKNGEFVEDIPIEDDGSPIFPPMEPEYESEDWKKLNEADQKSKMDEMIAEFRNFTTLEETHQHIAVKFVKNAKYNLDTAVLDFYKAWL